jgi:rhodanese-related sulfurtransferase
MTGRPDAGNSRDANSPESVALEIEVEAAGPLLASGSDVLLLDCREPDEFQFARIPGSRLIPMNEIPARLEEIAAYRERPLIVHCHHGGRSLRVVQFLRKQGFLRAQNMKGGIDAWSCRVDPSIPRY